MNKLRARLETKTVVILVLCRPVVSTNDVVQTMSPSGNKEKKNPKRLWYKKNKSQIRTNRRRANRIQQ